MPNWSGSLLTKKGLQLQAKAEAGVTLNLTKIKLGSGILQTGQDVQDLTDLIQPEQEIGIAQKVLEGNGQCTISGIITNESLTQGYYVRECGVYAQDPDEGEILYAVATDPNPDYLPAKGGSTAISEEFAIPIVVSNVENVTAEINLSSLATLEYVLNLIKNLFGLAEVNANMIKNTVKSWILETIQEWVETLGIAYNLQQNGYICFGKLFGGLILQWRFIAENNSDNITLPIAFKKKALLSLATDSFATPNTINAIYGSYTTSSLNTVEVSQTYLNARETATYFNLLVLGI